MAARKHSKVDRRELPAYALGEVAHYLAVPVSTIRYWSVGRNSYRPLIQPAAGPPQVLLSFLNLVELHVLAAIRREHEVSMPRVRRAIDYLARTFQSRHPLLSHQLETDGLDLFVQRYGQLVNISQDGQVAMREMLEAALRRIDRDPHGIPVKLYPFTRLDVKGAPRLVVIDPAIAGGRPVLVGTGLATEVIAERYKAGESIDELARDYERSEEEIEEAIRCELQAAA